MSTSPQSASPRARASGDGPLIRLAIVGRPNVGKSSLMNMLASRRVSIVDPTPGVTRDRVAALVDLEPADPREAPIKVEFVDTGGYGVYTAEGRQIDNAGRDLSALTNDIERQIALAIESADLILFVIDAQAGVLPQDEVVARLLRQGGLAGTSTASGDKVIVIANKVDGPRWEMHGLEAAGLGFGEPILVAAKNNYRRRELVEKLHDRVGKMIAARRRKGGMTNAQPERAADMMLAIVGKRNAGKSTLVNTLAGQQRVIVSEIAGTTRDAVDVRFEMDGRSLVAIDTAGLRKKKSFQDRVEWYALDRMQVAVDRADVAMLLIDATEPISQVDQHVAMMLAKSFKPAIIVVNKWDLAKGRTIAGGRGRKGRTGRAVTTGDYEEYLRAELKGLWYAPIAFISADTGLNVRETIDLAFELMHQSHQRATTGKLNRLVRGILERQGPANKLGTFAKVMFVAQVGVAPPTIVCVVNKPELFTPNYQRFLLNRFREELPFPEVPIKLLIRGRRKDEEFKPGDDAALAEAALQGEFTVADPGALDGAPSTGDDESFNHYTKEQIEAMFDEPGELMSDESDDGDIDAADDVAAIEPVAPTPPPARARQRKPARTQARPSNTSRRQARRDATPKGKPKGGKRRGGSR